MSILPHIASFYERIPHFHKPVYILTISEERFGHLIHFGMKRARSTRKWSEFIRTDFWVWNAININAVSLWRFSFFYGTSWGPFRAFAAWELLMVANFRVQFVGPVYYHFGNAKYVHFVCQVMENFLAKIWNCVSSTRCRINLMWFAWKCSISSQLWVNLLCVLNSMVLC